MEVIKQDLIDFTTADLKEYIGCSNRPMRLGKELKDEHCFYYATDRLGINLCLKDAEWLISLVYSNLKDVDSLFTDVGDKFVHAPVGDLFTKQVYAHAFRRYCFSQQGKYFRSREGGLATKFQYDGWKRDIQIRLEELWFQAGPRL